MTSAASRPVMLSAVQPSNNLTLGTYLGALKNWVTLQSRYDCLFFAVDLHAVTVRQDPRQLQQWTYEALATYLACGIDPAHALLFVQSHVPEHAQLAWLLSCYAYMGELGRMTQYKDKSARQGESIGVGLFTYPALMAADILLYQTQLVPVGEDQRQHLELTRDLALRMNNLYGEDLFTLPEGYHPPVGARIMSLADPTIKMSKSDPDPGSCIYLSDSDDVIRKKVKRAVTDSGSEITYEEQKPGIRNLLNIQAAITGKAVPELVAFYAGKQYGHLKVDTGELVAQAVGPIRDRVRDILADRSSLERTLRDGADQARERAQKTLALAYERVGFIPRH